MNEYQIRVAAIALSASVLMTACGGGAETTASTTGNMPTGTANPSTTAAPASQIAITNQPSSITVSEGAAATFSAAATGANNRYQWQSSIDGQSWIDIKGESSSILTISNVSIANSGTSFRVIVSDDNLSVTTNAAKLSVIASSSLPSIITQPNSQSVSVSQSVTFQVEATGSPTPQFQWQSSTDGSNYTDISGETKEAYNISETIIQDSGKHFRVRIFNDYGTITSDVVKLNVTEAALAPSIVQSPLPSIVVEGNVATFAATLTGSPSPQLQWQVSIDNGVTYNNITGAITATLRLTPTIEASGFKYRLTATNAAGSITTRPVMLIVYGAYTKGTQLSVFPNVSVALDATSSYASYPQTTGVNWSISQSPILSVASVILDDALHARLVPDISGQYQITATGVQGSATIWTRIYNIQTIASDIEGAVGLTPVDLLERRSCNACHALDRKIVGPSFTGISQKYKSTASANSYLAGKIVGGSNGAWGQIPMPENLVTIQEAEMLASWILSK